MLDLAISIDTDREGAAVIETNHGLELKSEDWPQDCEFQLIAFSQPDKTCEVIWPEQLAEDIALAVMTLEKTGVFKQRKPDWYRRLVRYSRDVSPKDGIRVRA